MGKKGANPEAWRPSENKKRERKKEKENYTSTSSKQPCLIGHFTACHT